jgi:hypothetical protein
MSCPEDSTFNCIVDHGTLSSITLLDVAVSASKFMARGGSLFATTVLSDVESNGQTLRQLAQALPKESQRTAFRFLDQYSRVDATQVAIDEGLDVSTNGKRDETMLAAIVLRATSLSGVDRGFGLWRTVQAQRLNANAEIDADTIVVCCSCSQAETDEHLRQHSPPPSGAELAAQLSVRFPRLLFSTESRAQVHKVPQGDPRLSGLINKLAALDRVAAQLPPHAPLDLGALPFRSNPESATRLRDYDIALVASGDDGVRRKFSVHCYLTPDEWRMYFAGAIDADGHLAIGYIGRKIGI